MSESGAAGPHAARVEVLTAEVHVLLVGSRQVTLSVYSQLDPVDRFDELTPFGRVRPRDADPDRVYIVGSSTRGTDSGALVRGAPFSSAYQARMARQLRKAADFKRSGADHQSWVGLTADECEEQADIADHNGKLGY